MEEEFLTKFDCIFKTGKEHLEELKRYLMFLESPLCDPEAANSDGMVDLIKEQVKTQEEFLNRYPKIMEDSDGKGA